MFEKKTIDIIADINESVTNVGNVIHYIEGTIADSSESVVNRLFNTYRIGVCQRKSIVAEYPEKFSVP